MNGVKVGDKVRFLNAVGGGVVTRFQGKDVVFVEGADGFEIPVLVREVVVVQPTNQYNFPVEEPKIKASASAGAETADEPEETELPEPEYTPPDEAVMLRAEAPEVERDGLVTYQTFENALAEARTAVPDELAELAGRAVWGEAGGIQDYAQRAAVIWCACNRADAWDMDIGDVLTVDQFHGLAIRGSVPEQHVELARDVLARWTLEAEGWQDVGRVLPERFL